MTRFPIRRLAVSMLLAVLALTLSGCWNPFAPDPVPPVPIDPAEYRDRITPEDVLHVYNRVIDQLSYGHGQSAQRHRVD